MSLSAGTHLGPYEILARIGAGGMGEVYRARDNRLKRDVALKVLPEAIARDTQRMARFERQAQLLASLNHPNIAALYGVEDSGGGRALVMGWSKARRSPSASAAGRSRSRRRCPSPGRSPRRSTTSRPRPRRPTPRP